MKKILTLLILLAAYVSTASAESWNLRCDINGENFNTAHNFIDGKVTLSLAAGTTIKFKVLESDNNTWYGNDGTMYWYNCTNWTFSTSGNNCTLIAAKAGDYVFNLNTSIPSVSVTYPTDKTIYFCNNKGWDQPYLYILEGDYWSDAENGGSGSNGKPNGIAMTRIPDTDIWKADYPSTVEGYIAFLKSEQNSYEHFHNTEAVYKTDFDSAIPLFVPNTSYVTKNGTNYYNGSWFSYPSSYTRDGLTSGKFGTLCLPFAATVTGATVFKITEKVIEGGNLSGVNLESVEGVEAGKPYIFKASGSTLSATFTGSSYVTEPVADFAMVGNLGSTITINTIGDYIVKDNTIRKIVSGGSADIPQYRAYISGTALADLGEATARGMYFIGYEDETTGIENVQSYQNSTVYNLHGQRVKDAQKGLFIVNGKIVLCK